MQQTCLINAAKKGDLVQAKWCVQLLLHAGSDLEAADPQQRTAVWWASSNGHVEIVEHLQGT